MQLQVHNENPGRYGRNTDGLVNLNTKAIIIIIIKKGRQCKVEREWYAYQSEDPSPTIPTYRQKEEKGKRVEDYPRDRAA